MNVLALDPGLTKPGLAVLVDGKIVYAVRLRTETAWKKLGILHRCELVARSAHCHSRLHSPFVPDTAVVEFPRWYPGNSKGIDPNDLAGLCGIAGAFAALVREKSPDVKILSPKPSEVWGSLPKTTTGNPWKSPRGQRLASRLSSEERDAVEPYHDALDAAGLALWAAGRWQTRRNYPGAV